MPKHRIIITQGTYGITYMIGKKNSCRNFKMMTNTFGDANDRFITLSRHMR